MKLLQMTENDGLIIFSYVNSGVPDFLYKFSIGLAIVSFIIGMIIMMTTKYPVTGFGIVAVGIFIGIFLFIGANVMAGSEESRWAEESATLINERYAGEQVTGEQLRDVDLINVLGSTSEAQKVGPISSSMVRDAETGKWQEESLYLIVDGNVVELFTEVTTD